MDVAEVVCGDPSCAPIDTVFTLVWQSGGKGVFALPMLAAEVTKEDLIDAFPVSIPIFSTFHRSTSLYVIVEILFFFCSQCFRMKIFCASGTPARKPGGPGFRTCVSRSRTVWNAVLAPTLSRVRPLYVAFVHSRLCEMAMLIK